MAKPQKKAAKLEDIELHSDAWQRFEKFVDKNVRTTAAKPTPSRAKTAIPKRKCKG